jgi:hypothetical protein
MALTFRALLLQRHLKADVQRAGPSVRIRLGGRSIRRSVRLLLLLLLLLPSLLLTVRLLVCVAGCRPARPLLLPSLPVQHILAAGLPGDAACRRPARRRRIHRLLDLLDLAPARLGRSRDNGLPAPYDPGCTA